MHQRASRRVTESPDGSTPTQVVALRSWRWRRAALLLAGAAQLITISALVGADRPPADWPSLLLATAPAVLAAAAAFAPSPVNLLAAVVGCLVLIAGAVGAWDHTGLFFVPALAALVVAGVRLWDERS
jgi:hypothetical protein